MAEAVAGPAARTERVLVVGAGIAGLSTAILLGRLGMQVTVAERSAQRADGAGITIQNQGINVLQTLGVLEECLKFAFVSESGNVYDNFFDAEGSPRELPQVPRRPEDGLPAYIQIYRPRFADILAARAEDLGAKINRECSVTQVADEGASVRVEFGDGSIGNYDLVIGADGTNSKVRHGIFGEIEQTYSGNMSLRWVKNHGPVGQRGFYVNEKSAPVVVSYPAEDVIYVATGIDMENRPVAHDEAIAILRDVVGSFPAKTVQNIYDLIEDDDEVIVRPYILHNLPAPWHKGRIAIIGDAAHSVSAHLGIGGVLALEDAAVLFEELSFGDDLESALTRYGKRRAIRTFFAVDACRQMLDLQVHYAAAPWATHRIRQRALGDLVEAF